MNVFWFKFTYKYVLYHFFQVQVVDHWISGMIVQLITTFSLVSLTYNWLSTQC